MVGLPDTIWFPEDALRALPDDALSFLLFPVERPELFDAVLTDAAGRVLEIRVKQPDVGCRWVWGAFKMPGAVLHELHRLWLERGRADEYIGTLVNAYLAAGGHGAGDPCGTAYVDVGTLHGYREAIRLLASEAAARPRRSGPRRKPPAHAPYSAKRFAAACSRSASGSTTWI